MSFLRVGICFLLAFAVLAFGAVEEWAQALVEIGFCILLISWAARMLQKKWDRVYFSPLLAPLGTCAIVVIVQMALHKTVSIYNTRVQLHLLLAYIILIFLMSQAFQRTSHWRNFIWFLML